MNILFIMYDQLRFDYLSCAGHPVLKTPNFDRVAAMGVRFTQAHVQSPVCGSSRMSFYTGRYASSHGAQWNGYPLRVGEMTMGDHLRALGMGCYLIGKTHMVADAEGMARLGLAADTVIGARQSECGFDAVVRDDGLWGEGPDGFYDRKRSPYNEYLKEKGYPSDNPWQDFANAGVSGDDIASGWFFRNADKPANVREEDSETPWLTDRALDFLQTAVVRASLLHQAALALYRARALSRHVRPRGRSARRPVGGGAPRSASRLRRLHGQQDRPVLFPRRGSGKGHPRLHGPDPAV